MSIAPPESAVDCGGVGVAGDASASPEESRPPIDPENPGPGIDAIVNRTIAALRLAQPDTPPELHLLGL